jgi:hypothetical protein
MTACLLIPTAKVIFTNISPSLQRIEHFGLRVDHDPDVMDAFWIVLAIARAAEEDGITCTSLRKRYFPIQRMLACHFVTRDNHIYG